ncbi:MAG: hypothetical protein HXY22_11200 [Alphaproteobacteria bacterium]|nr:hypothetical protein [Alphaproteobacteria bacterium]
MSACLPVWLGLDTPAFAAMPPEAFIQARQTAVNHVHVRIESVTPPSGGAGDCSVSATVVQIFRGDLTRGQVITFPVSCYRYGELQPGNQLWTDFEALSHAQYLEAFMSGGPAPVVLSDQVEIITAPREWPFCATDSVICETSIVAVEAPSQSCGFFDRAWTLWGLVGEDCGGKAGKEEDGPLPALRMR